MKLAVPLALAAGAVVGAEVVPTMDAGVVQVVTLAITTVGGCVVAYLAFKTAQIGKSQTKMEQTQTEMGKAQTTSTEKLAELEKNTNSITTQLKESAGLLGRAVGKVEGRAELQAEQAQFAKGKAEVQPTTSLNPQEPAKPAETTVNMEVNEMNVDELNAPPPPKKK